MSDFNENPNGEQTNQTESSVSSVEPVLTEQPSFNEAQIVAGVEPAKKKPVLLIVAIIVIILGAGAAAAYSFIPWVKNNVRMLISKPESYYSWVEEQNLAKTADNISESYGKALDSVGGQTTQEIELKADLDSTNVGALIESLTGSPLSESGITLPSSIAIKSSASVDNGNTNGAVQINANDTALATINVIMQQDGKYYYQIPELSPSYISMDTAALMEAAYDEMDPDAASFIKSYTDTMTSISTDPNALKELISESDLNKLILNYGTIMYENVGDVDLEKGVSCDVNGVDAKYNRLSVKISDEDAFKMIKKILKDAKKDKTIINIIEKFGLTEEQYVAGIDSLITETDNEEPSDDEITMNVFVDSNGKICGRSFELPIGDDEDPDTDKVTFAYMTVEDKSENAFEVTFDVNEYGSSEGFKICGTSKESSGKKNGEVKLTLNNIDDDGKTIEIPLRYNDIETVNEEKGYCKGVVTLDLSYFGMPSINLDLDSDGNGQTVKSDITIGGTNYGTITITIRDENTIEIPSFDSTQKVYQFTEDGAELQQYITDASATLPAFIDNIGSTFGVPGLGQLIGAAMNGTTGNIGGITSDPVISDPDIGNINTNEPSDDVTYDFKKFSLQINDQAITLPAKINGILDLVKVEDQQIEASGFESYYSEDYSLGVNISNDSDAAAAPADCTVTGITVSNGSAVTFTVDGFTVGSKIADVAAKYGASVPSEEYGSLTIYDTASEWNSVTFYYYNGAVDSISFNIFDY